MKNDNGITLISLIVSVIIVAILASLTIITGNNAYNQIKIQGAKSELEEVQRLVEEIASDYKTFLKEYEDDNDNNYVKYFAERYGATGEKTFENKLLKKNLDKVELLYEQIHADENLQIDTDSNCVFYLTKEDLVKFFGLKGVDSVVVDFSTVRAYSVKGIEDRNKGEIYWTPSDWGAKSVNIDSINN